MLNKDSAQKISAIKIKTFRAKKDIETVIAAVTVHMADHLRNLEVLKILNDRDYVLFLLSDTTGITPKVVSWGYAEKSVDNKSIIFSSGNGGENNEDMFIQSCAILSRSASDQQQDDIQYVAGAKLLDENDEIQVAEKLTDEEFASFITNIVNPAQVGLTRDMISASEEEIKTAIAETETN